MEYEYTVTRLQENALAMGRIISGIRYHLHALTGKNSTRIPFVTLYAFGKLLLRRSLRAGVQKDSVFPPHHMSFSWWREVHAADPLFFTNTTCIIALIRKLTPWYAVLRLSMVILFTHTYYQYV